jgi:16S rRNA (guanine527-N7)-methyltransferase
MSNELKVNQFLELFEKWNKRINLSAASTRAELEEHVVDSRHVLPVLESTPDVVRVLDVGSGGGFPVVIAAICLPTIQFVSVEAIHKKHAFLRTAARELGLSNLDCRAERLEDHPDHDYDAAMSRATFDLGDWLRIGANYVRISGRVIGFEGQARTDLQAVERLPYALNGKSRAIVWCVKGSDVPRGTLA